MFQFLPWTTLVFPIHLSLLYSQCTQSLQPILLITTRHNSSNQSNRYKREDRIQKQPSIMPSNQSTQPINHIEQKQYANLPKTYSGEKISSHNPKEEREIDYAGTSESDSVSYQTFPLRLKKQYV